MAAAVSSVWAKPGAWALEAEEHEAELKQQTPLSTQKSSVGDSSDFPSLVAATTTKTKKKKGQTLSLAGFGTFCSANAAPSPQTERLTPAELRQQAPPSNHITSADSSDFPSLASAATTKTKKKKGRTLSLTEFTTYVSAKAASCPQTERLTPAELVSLPTGPRERSDKELEGGFHSKVLIGKLPIMLGNLNQNQNTQLKEYNIEGRSPSIIEQATKVIQAVPNSVEGLKDGKLEFDFQADVITAEKTLANLNAQETLRDFRVREVMRIEEAAMLDKLFKEVDQANGGMESVRKNVDNYLAEGKPAEAAAALEG